MIIKVQHKNGTPLQSTVTRGELTAEMRDRLRIPAGNTVEDYADFNVWRNKRGEVRAVRPQGRLVPACGHSLRGVRGSRTTYRRA